MLLELLPAVLMFLFFVFLFCRELRLDAARYLEQERLGDEHMLREMKKYLEEKM